MAEQRSPRSSSAGGAIDPTNDDESHHTNIDSSIDDAAPSSSSSSSSDDECAQDAADRLFRDSEILAPMVRASTTPLRVLALSHGATLVYTEELIDRSILQCDRHVNAELGTIDYRVPRSSYSPKVQRRMDADADNPDSGGGAVLLRIDPSIEGGRLVYQIGTGESGLALRAAARVIEDVDGIDVEQARVGEGAAAPPHGSPSDARLREGPDRGGRERRGDTRADSGGRGARDGAVGDARGGDTAAEGHGVRADNSERRHVHEGGHIGDEEEEQLRRGHAREAGVVQREHLSTGRKGGRLREDGGCGGGGRRRRRLRTTTGGRGGPRIAEAADAECGGAAPPVPSDKALGVPRLRFPPPAFANVRRARVHRAMRAVQESPQECQVRRPRDDERPTRADESRTLPRHDVRGGAEYRERVQVSQPRRSR